MERLPILIAAPSGSMRNAMRVKKWAERLSPGATVHLVGLNRGDDEEFQAKHQDFFKRHPNAVFPSIQAFGFKTAIMKSGLNHSPFIWLEPDSPPVVENFDVILTEEYGKAVRNGKKFLLSSDTHPPHDLVGGIGVYPEMTDSIIPHLYAKHGWDLWLMEHMRGLVETTDLIQHKYGIYDKHGNARAMNDAEVKGVLRSNAVVFHRDKNLSLIPKDVQADSLFYHTGDIGDIVAFLPIMRKLGGGKLIIGNHTNPDPAWRKMEGSSFNALKPLVDEQPYVTGMEFCHECRSGAVDMEWWRKAYVPSRNLINSQAAYVGIPLEYGNESPWLTIGDHPKIETTPIVVARSARYHNPKFPWRHLVSKYRGRMTFIGLADEHSDFCRQFGNVPHARTENLLEAAQILSAAKCAIVNQTSLWWIAAGLGVPTLQETRQWGPDSMILRDTLRFTTLPDVTKCVGFIDKHLNND